MGYLIVPNYFAPKHPRYVDDAPHIHAILYDRCTFNCRYCSFPGKRNNVKYIDYTPSTFRSKVEELLPLGNRFKFTGGEPTLNPDLFELLTITKSYDGSNYLDTNGSLPDVLATCVSRGLVDVAGLSLKGLNPSESKLISRCVKKSMCWDNVFRAIDICCSNDISTLVTIVCYSDFSLKDLEEFASLLAPYPDVYLKLNSWIPDEAIPYFGKTEPSTSHIRTIIDDFLHLHPSWRNRIVFIPELAAASEESRIVRT